MPDARKRAIRRAVALLQPGGTFANSVVASHPELQAAFEAAIGRPGGETDSPPSRTSSRMRAAGLEQVDCGGSGGFALMVGQAPRT